MHSEITNGSQLNIQGLVCNIPPEGYIVNIKSGELEYRGIHSRSEIQSEQYWERTPLPDWYKAVMKLESAYNKKRKNDDAPFFDEQLEVFTKQEWDRRLHGFWFLNNGKPTYITGGHYMYLQWWQIDIGYPKFRITDLEYFYFLQYCIEDPCCMGMLEITKRRFGKTFRGGLFLYEYITRTREANGGIQSKTGPDAKKMFGKAVVKPFKKLPKFFRPEYDLSLGITPKTEIRFQQTNVRGKEAIELLENEELGSLIDFQSAELLAYDGQKVHRYFSDEWAKTIEVDIYERHEVIRYCLLDDEGNIIGKALYSSTVEKLDTEREGVQEGAIKLWDDSDQDQKGEDGRTVSGLYRFFMTADRTRFIDKYGYADVEKTIKAILLEREKVKNKPKAYAARLRKEARTIDEAFYSGNDLCEFDAENITNEIKELERNPVFLRQCRLILKKEVRKSIVIGKPDKTITTVSYMDDAKGGWFLLEEPEQQNHFAQRGDYFEPLNTMRYCIGVDTTQDRIAIDGSNPCILVFKKSFTVEGKETGNYPVALWISPTRLDIHFDEEVKKACLWFGAKANYELDRRTDFYKYFCQENVQAFLQWTPKVMQNPLKKKDPEYGQRSGDPFQLGQQLQLCKTYVDGSDNEIFNGHVQRIKFPTLLKQLLKYNHLDRTKSDQVVALMMALGGVFEDIQQPFQKKSIKTYLPQFKIRIPA